MKKRHAFSLLELSIALVISGFVAAVYLKVNDSSKASIECTAATRIKIQDIGGAIERFARKNDQLPMPAARNIGVEDWNYGREAAPANITQSGGVSFGAVPFQTLGLPVDYASDCWGNKLTYMVTTALTTNSNSGGYLDSGVEGNITLKSTTALAANTMIAYAVLSHGEDQLGAVKNNYTHPTDTKWCIGTRTLTTINCLATANASSIVEVANGTFNNGNDAGNDYFDDIVLAKERPRILYPPTNMYGWGQNTGGIGDGTYTQRLLPANTVGGLTFRSVARSNNMSCGLTTAGKLYCMGGGYHIYPNYTANVPTAVVPTDTFTSIAVGEGHNGDDHICGINTAGDVYCWGENADGQLGNDDPAYASQTTPNPLNTITILGSKKFTSLSAGWRRTCGITTDGDAYCWGMGSNGALGDGGTSKQRVPSPVSLAAKFSKISVGGFHACGIITTGKAYCWGGNQHGGLGNGTSGVGVHSLTPLPVSGGHYFKEISAGTFHSCGITTAGEVYCWGYNDKGQLGNNDPAHIDRTIPVLIDTTRFTSISAGSDYTCGLTTTGEAYCWGNNNKGQLGDGSTTNSDIPKLVAGGHRFSQIAVYGTYTMAIAAPEKAYCWATTHSGDGSGTAYDAPSSSVAGGLHFTRIIAGKYHTSCGITTTDTAYCWGYNNYGAIGNNSNVVQSSPVPVDTSLTSTFTQISVGDYHSCGINAAGKAYCWGWNDRGTLGNNFSGAGQDKHIPTPVSGTLVFVQIAAGTYHSCGITTTGKAYCWGERLYGKIGDNNIATTPIRKNPKGVDITAHPTIKFVQISVGWGHSCGLTTTGEVFCWGLNGRGQLGSAGGNKWVPTAITGVPATTRFKQLSAGEMHTCALTTTGTAYCWGENNQGELGVGSMYVGTPIPQLVDTSAIPNPKTFISISAARSHTCAMTADNRSYCWGWNQDGQVDTSGIDRAFPTIVPTSLTFGTLATSGIHNCALAY